MDALRWILGKRVEGGRMKAMDALRWIFGCSGLFGL